MYLASFTYKNKDNYGVLTKDKTAVIPMGILLEGLNKDTPGNLLEFIRISSDNLIAELEGVLKDNMNGAVSLEDIELTSPIPYPRRNVFCLGKNYRDHAMEVKSLSGGADGIPKHPIYFTKIADPAVGNGDKIIIPSEITNKLDYEVELALIIGKDGKNILPEEAEDYIFGYAIGNDISARDIQMKHAQWFKGKSLDTATSIGPYIVYKSKIQFPPSLDISCKINGELRQSSNTNKLIFDIPYIISDLSKGLTLRAGDIILTGTPAGVGIGFESPKFLKSGDVIEATIDKIGTLVNYVE